MKISSIPKSGRKGSVVYVNSPHGKVTRQYVRPGNPRTSDQKLNHNNFGVVSSRSRARPPIDRPEVRH